MAGSTTDQHGRAALTLAQVFARRATAPNLGNCRGRASRGRDEPDATLKRASCVVGPVARPSAVPRQIGKAASQHGKARKAVGESRKPEVDKGKKFPKVSHPPTGGFPIWCAEAKPPGGEGRRVKLASTRRLPGWSLATRGGAPASQIRRGSAQPRTVLRGLRELCARYSTPHHFNAKPQRTQSSQRFFWGER